MPPHEESAVQAIVDAVFDSRKYDALSPEFVHAIAVAEARKGRSFKETVKATKNQLHQSAAAYQTGRMDYDRWFDELSTAYTSASIDDRRQVLLSVLARHRSTAERLPILNDFYTTIFAHLPPVQSVLDVACGFNPLAHAWMPLNQGALYFACDVFADQVEFLNRFFGLAGIKGEAETRDVIQNPPSQPVDLVLILKTIPCLEQIDRHAGQRLLDTVDARHLVVTYPVRSLGGRAKGMAAHYAAHFHNLVDNRGWHYQQLDFSEELVFVVTTHR
jgi:16S rRNA (guanine(1405)-N(7))-methyltransferase